MTDDEIVYDETSTDEDTVLVHMVAYENSSNMDVEYDDDGLPRVTNHDELEKYHEVRRLKREAVEEYGLERDIVTPDDSFWDEEFRELDVGEAVRL